MRPMSSVASRPGAPRGLQWNLGRSPPRTASDYVPPPFATHSGECLVAVEVDLKTHCALVNNGPDVAGGFLDLDAAGCSTDLRPGDDEDPVSLHEDLLRLGPLFVERVRR